MTKEELINLTLKQLIDSLGTAPQNFRLEDQELGYSSNRDSFMGPTIIWQFKVEMSNGYVINDPLNSTKTIIVTFNKMAKQISCYIYFREVNSTTTAMMPESQATQQLLDIPILNRNYRLFTKLRKKLIQLKREKECVDYIKKLSTIFPTTHDDELFK